jgi:excinuclease UvrABC ATPase subunit
MIEQPCQTCGGKRLRPESLSVLVNGASIGDVVELPVERAIEFFNGIPLRGSNGASGNNRVGRSSRRSSIGFAFSVMSAWII